MCRGKKKEREQKYTTAPVTAPTHMSTMRTSSSSFPRGKIDITELVEFLHESRVSPSKGSLASNHMLSGTFISIDSRIPKEVFKKNRKKERKYSETLRVSVRTNVAI